MRDMTSPTNRKYKVWREGSDERMKYKVWREGSDKRTMMLTYADVIKLRRKGYYVVEVDK